MGKIKITESALSDLDDIEKYIAADSPRVAKRFIEKIFSAIELLENQPESGRIVPEFVKKI